MKSVSLALVSLLVSGSVYASTSTVWSDSRAAAFGPAGFKNACVSADKKYLKSIAAVNSLTCTAEKRAGNEGDNGAPDCVVNANKVAMPIVSKTQVYVSQNAHAGNEGGGEETGSFQTVTSKISTTQAFQVISTVKHGGEKEGSDESAVISTGSYKIPACK